MSNILLIDDDEDQIVVFSMLLEKHGFNVFSASDVSNAFKILSQANIDIVVCDIMMPKPNGVEFVKSLKENTSHCSIPVIMLTAGRPDLEEDLLDLGVREICLKRNAQRTLVPMINHLLQDSPS